MHDVHDNNLLWCAWNDVKKSIIRRHGRTTGTRGHQRRELVHEMFGIKLREVGKCFRFFFFQSLKVYISNAHTYEHYRNYTGLRGVLWKLSRVLQPYLQNKTVKWCSKNISGFWYLLVTAWMKKTRILLHLLCYQVSSCCILLAEKMKMIMR